MQKYVYASKPTLFLGRVDTTTRPFFCICGFVIGDFKNDVIVVFDYMRYEVYTDGSCKGNPGPGGIGAVVYKDGSVEHTFSQGYYRTTNNRMELRAIIEVLKRFGDVETITVWTDSEYARKGITEWMGQWKQRSWMRKEKGRMQPVKNVDLWKLLDDLVDPHVVFRWIKGHSNEEGNETADALATKASARGPFVHDEGFGQ